MRHRPTDHSFLDILGGIPLKGTIRAEGAKNAALPLLAATLLVKGTTCLSRVPDLEDVNTMIRLLTAVGATVHRDGHQVWVDASGPLTPNPPDALVQKMRASLLIMGPLMARLGNCSMALPGGCAIGRRPIDLHLRGLSQLGAEVAVADSRINMAATRLQGSRIYLDLPSVTTTENLLMAASVATGTTIIVNAAREPEIVNLADLLTKMGAKIHGAGSRVITVHGVQHLRPVRDTVIPDRIEVGTYLLVAAATKGDITVTGVNTQHLDSVLQKLAQAGTHIEIGDDWVRCRNDRRLQPITLHTMPYPGFPTDLQAPMVAALSLAAGVSTVTETVFDSRFSYVNELRRLGAEITVSGATAAITGVERIVGNRVAGTDLRGTAALLIAALAAEGRSQVYGLQHLDRGYADVEQKLASVGAQIQRSVLPISQARPVF